MLRNVATFSVGNACIRGYSIIQHALLVAMVCIKPDHGSATCRRIYPDKVKNRTRRMSMLRGRSSTVHSAMTSRCHPSSINPCGRRIPRLRISHIKNRLTPSGITTPSRQVELTLTHTAGAHNQARTISTRLSHPGVIYTNHISFRGRSGQTAVIRIRAATKSAIRIDLVKDLRNIY